ncbi:MAG: ABC transporter substrate-binding protein, partial [Bacteroidales bacterium]
MSFISTESFVQKQTFRTMLWMILSVAILGCKGKIENKSKSSVDSQIADTTTYATCREVIFLPYWVTSAQFAGYYVALETGIYEKYGIRLTIIPYEPFTTPKGLISEGKVDFAALWLVNAIELKASGTDIVNIAQLSS